MGRWGTGRGEGGPDSGQGIPASAGWPPSDPCCAPSSLGGWATLKVAPGAVYPLRSSGSVHRAMAGQMLQGHSGVPGGF